MLSQFLASVNVKNGSEIWLGGRQMDFHNFNWGDGSLFNYSYWEPGEPSFPAEKCIEMSWRNGRWNDINCRLKRAVLCERQVTSRLHIKPILYQPTTCLDSNCTGSSGPANSQNIGAAPGSGPGGSTGDVDMPGADLDQQTSSLNGTQNSTSSLSDAAANFMIPPDDKPIKVITSIMNREQQQLSPATAPSHAPDRQQAPLNTTNALESNGTFVHYNPTPPERMLAANGTQTTETGGPPLQNSSSLTLSARRDGNQMGDDVQKPATIAAAPQDNVNQLTMGLQEEQATVSLLDKIKPQAGTTVTTTPSRAPTQWETDSSNATSRGAQKDPSFQSEPQVVLSESQSQMVNSSEAHA